ncbi:MAG TPA: Tom37 metaxin N-terminal-like domain-containing protein [Xanthobacteraceae bacterium]|jgi:glutathione S-transferase
MTCVTHGAIKLFQFPRMFGIPNISPFCCKLETWLRITKIPYEVVDVPNPRKGPKGKVPFIEDAGQRLGDSSAIIDYLKDTRQVDPDVHLDDSQSSTSLLVQRTLEEHFAFITLYTHFIRDDGWRETRAFFDAMPAPVRPLVTFLLRKQMRKALWLQGISRHSDKEIMNAAMSDWMAVLAAMSDGPYFHGDRPSSIDATLLGALATTVLTPIQSPIRDFLRSQSKCVTYAERMMGTFFPEMMASRK